MSFWKLEAGRVAGFADNMLGARLRPLFFDRPPGDRTRAKTS
ncbi:hypothetical protein OCT51_02560 [Halomonas sp. LR3S48]|nr:hypothetical protein [Halomonas sp. LR3S48]UYG04262.1 hypothetical protein OCT51_02560 [Halomonas sp. LR3S48]